MNPRRLGKMLFPPALFFVLTVLALKKDHLDRSGMQNFLQEAIDEINSIAKSGDLIFRRVESGGSTFVLMTDSKSEFSHVGIVWKSQHETYVIHVIPSGDSSDNCVYINMVS